MTAFLAFWIVCYQVGGPRGIHEKALRSMTLLFVVIGFVLMVVGADYFVKGAVKIASRLGLPPLVVGLTIVAWGTSMPELAVTLGAASKETADATGLALGNVIGSNIANVLLIGGFAALLLPLTCPPSQLRRDVIWLGLASLGVVFIGATGYLSAWMGLLLLGLLLAQTLTIYRAVRTGHIRDVEVPSDEELTMPLSKAVGLFVVGLIAVIAGSELLVRNAIEIAQALQIPGAVIGVTMVAIGTSLPELMTSIAAARQGQKDVIIGNIIGSNIANIVLVLGAVSILSPGVVPSDLLDGDGWVMLASSAVFVALLLFGRTVGRVWGALFLTSYGFYVAWQFSFFGLL